MGILQPALYIHNSQNDFHEKRAICMVFYLRVMQKAVLRYTSMHAAKKHPMQAMQYDSQFSIKIYTFLHSHKPTSMYIIPSLLGEGLSQMLQFNIEICLSTE